MTAYQLLFPVFEGWLNRSGVLSLCVFKPEVIKDKGYAGDKVVGGQQQEVAYSTWLRFYSPLSHSANEVTL